MNTYSQIFDGTNSKFVAR